MRYFYTAIVSILLLTACNKKMDKQPLEKDGSIALTGKIKNQTPVAGDLNVLGFFVSPLNSGTITEDGTFNLKLPADFIAVTQQAFDDYNSQDAAAYELKMNTAQDMYVNLDGLETRGLDQQLALAGMYYGFQVFNNGQRYGAIYPTSSVEFMTYILEQKHEGAVTGHYYYFVYATSETVIKGETSFDELLSNETNETSKVIQAYDINIQPGWNILKYEILETVKTGYDTYIPARTKQSTVKSMEAQALWYHISGNKATRTDDAASS